MSDLPNCPKCGSEYAYEDGAMLVCPMCGHEWSQGTEEPAEAVIRDGSVVDTVDLKRRVKLFQDHQRDGYSSHPGIELLVSPPQLRLSGPGQRRD